MVCSSKILKSIGLTILPLFFLTIAACGQFTSKASLPDPNGIDGTKFGCLQGNIVDGLTGQPLSLLDLSKAEGSGIHVLAGGRRLAGVGAASVASPLSGGSYTLCDVPLDETYSMAVRLEGYQPLDGVVRIESTVKPKSDRAIMDLVKPVPVEIVNLKLYPVGVATQDFTVSVSYAAEALKDAKVFLQPSGTVADKQFLDAKHYLVPINVMALPLSGVTDAAGRAVFAGKDLVLGLTYKYTILPAAHEPVLQPYAGLAVVGGSLDLQSETRRDVQQPFAVFVDLSSGIDDVLKIVSRSNETGDFNDTGVLRLVFNRPIEVVQSSLDKFRAVLAHNTKADLVSDISNNDAAESAVFEINQSSPNEIVLSPKWKVEPEKDGTGEWGLKIRYEGLVIRPKASPGTLMIKNLETLLKEEERTVSFFSGETPVQVATAMHAVGGDKQSGRAESPLAQDIAVQVVDQYGHAMRAGATVVFETKNAGSVAPSITGFGGPSLSVTADSSGLAKVRWILGSQNGEQKLSASLVLANTSADTKVDPIIFTAISIPYVKSIQIIDGNGQSADVDSDLQVPVKIALIDQSGRAFAGQQLVSFQINGFGGTNLGLLKTLDGNKVDSKLVVSADVQSGLAAVNWHLGSTPGIQTLTVSTSDSAVIAAKVTATARAVLDHMNADSPTALKSMLRQEQTISVQLIDRDGRPYLGNTTGMKFAVESDDRSLTGGAASYSLRTAAGIVHGPEVTVAVSNTTGKATLFVTPLTGKAGSSIRISAITSNLAKVDFAIEILPTLNDAIRTSLDMAPLAKDEESTLEVSLKNQDGGDFAKADVAVIFTIVKGISEIRDIKAGSLPSTSTITVKTDSAGKAKAIFKLKDGKTGDDLSVTAKADGVVTLVSFTGKVK